MMITNNTVHFPTINYICFLYFDWIKSLATAAGAYVCVSENTMPQHPASPVEGCLQSDIESFW